MELLVIVGGAGRGEFMSWSVAWPSLGIRPSRLSDSGAPGAGDMRLRGFGTWPSSIRSTGMFRVGCGRWGRPGAAPGGGMEASRGPALCASEIGAGDDALLCIGPGASGERERNMGGCIGFG